MKPQRRKRTQRRGARAARAWALAALGLLCGFAQHLDSQVRDPLPLRGTTGPELLRLGTQEAFELKDGDRVVLLGNAFAEREGLHGHIESALTRRFPGRALSFRNLGWSGDAVDVRFRPNGFPALETWLEETRPTVIVAAYGMNESFGGEKGLPAFRKALGEHLALLERTKARLVLLSPVRHERPAAGPPDSNAALRLYGEALREAARERGHRFVDLFDLPGGRPLTENGIHLSPDGYARAAAAIERALGLAPEPWSVEVAASGLVARASGTTIAEAGPLRFKAADAFLPRPGDRRTLRVTGLAAGRTALRVDGAPAASASAEEWARGVELSRGPEFDRAEELRRAVVLKNELWFHRFRPQNAEYIYGTRSRAQGANVGNPQFASEFRYVESLVREKEGEIARLALPAPRLYELVRE